MQASKSETVSTLPSGRAGRALRSITLTLLAIEFLDEILDGTFRAAWPLIRQDLQLSYAEIGLLLSIPLTLANFIEPFFGILADIGRRRALVLAGGLLFALALMLVAASSNFTLLFIAFIILNPASGAFVSISQVVLMDSDPSRHEQSMARWVLAGSLGNVAGPFALALFVAANIGGWRATFVALSVCALLLVARVGRSTFVEPARDEATAALSNLLQGVRAALQALRRREVLRWLVLLEIADIMEKGFQAYLALYFVDVVGLSEASAGLVLIVWMGAMLLGNLLLIPLLERVRGLAYLRLSVAVTLLALALFLVAPTVMLKLAALGLMGFANAGWYAILKAQLYSSMPGRSGVAITLANLGGLIGGIVPLALGLVAAAFGLQTMMWLLMASPAALLFLIPRRK